MPEKLKKGWTRVAFGDVVRQVRDRVDPEDAGLERYIAGEHMETDDLKIRRWGLIGDGYLGPAFHMRFKQGHVLYGSRRTYLRKVAVADFEGITANTTFVLESKDPKVLLPELLPFLMQTESFHEHSIKQSKGSVNPYINYSDLTWYKFALPPLEEQRRIAELLTASSALGKALRGLAIGLETVRKTLINNLTEKEGWPSTTIGALCQMQNGRPFPSAVYAESGIKLLRPGNLGPSGFLIWNPSKTTYLAEKWEDEARDFVIGTGDVIMNLTAQSLEDGFLGRVCFAQQGDKSLLNQRIGRFYNWSPGVVPEYVFRVFQTSRFQRHVMEMCEGSKVKHLFWPYISRFPFGLPSLEVQNSVVLSLRALDISLVQASERSNAQGRLHCQIIAKALQGDGSLSTVETKGRTCG